MGMPVPIFSQTISLEPKVDLFVYIRTMRRSHNDFIRRSICTNRVDMSRLKLHILCLRLTVPPILAESLMKSTK